jgi:hypothetical protein
VRTTAATACERLCAGQASTVVTRGESVSGTAVCVAGPAGDRQVRQVADLGHGQGRAGGQGVPGGQDGDLLFGQQVLGVEARQGVEGALHECHVGAAVAEHAGLISQAAQQHLDLGCAGFGGVGVEEFRSRS